MMFPTLQHGVVNFPHVHYYLYSCHNVRDPDCNMSLLIINLFELFISVLLRFSSDSALKNTSSDFKKMGQRIFVFIIGGATRSEVEFQIVILFIKRCSTAFVHIAEILALSSA